MEQKKGFTIMELVIVIGLLIVVAGLFTVNMIRVNNKNKEDEIKNVENQLISAADAYVTMNPSAVQELYDGYGYVEIRVGDLREAGLVNNDLKDPETGERISDDKLIYVTVNEYDELVFTYDSGDSDKLGEVIGWDLKYNDITLVVDDSTESWCDGPGVNQGITLLKNRKEESTSGEKIEADIKAIKCDVNRNKVGNYQIVYEYNDPGKEIRKKKNRNVYVISPSDNVASFTARITNYENGTKIPQGASDVDIEITEKTNDGNKTFSISNDYEVTGLDTSKQGTYKATVRKKSANKDGTRPSSVDLSYTVTSITITFNATGGSVNPDTKIVEYGKTYGALPTPTKNGYKFLGWYKEKEGINQITAQSLVNTKGNHTLYASWQKTEVSYTVYHKYMDTNGEYTETVPMSYIGTFGTRVQPELKPVMGFTSPKQSYIDLKESNNTMVYYYTRNKYTITFNMNGGIYTGETYSSTLYYGTKINLGIPTKTNYKFEKWTTNSGAIDSSNIFTMGAGNAVVSADWRKYTSADSLAVLLKNGVVLKDGTPDFSKVSPPTDGSPDDSGLYAMADEDGMSYYFRGNITQNYVKFGKFPSELYRGVSSYAVESFRDYKTQNECNTATSLNKYCLLSPNAGKDMYWRIIRINGDGSVRMIYTGYNAYANGSRGGVINHECVTGAKKCNAYEDDFRNRHVLGKVYFNPYLFYDANIGYMYNSETTYNSETLQKNEHDSNIKFYLEDWYKTVFEGSVYTRYLSDEVFCNDRSTSSIENKYKVYGASDRLSVISRKFTPTYRCDMNKTIDSKNDKFTVDSAKGNGKLKYPIGLITADEMVAAGGKNGTRNDKFFLYISDHQYWTMTPYQLSYASQHVGSIFSNEGSTIDAEAVANAAFVSPVINLSAEAFINMMGTGIASNPYRIE